MADELSYNAAMIEAGLRKKKFQADCNDITAAVKAISKHFTLEQLTEAWKDLK